MFLAFPKMMHCSMPLISAGCRCIWLLAAAGCFWLLAAAASCTPYSWQFLLRFAYILFTFFIVFWRGHFSSILERGGSLPCSIGGGNGISIGSGVSVGEVAVAMVAE